MHQDLYSKYTGILLQLASSASDLMNDEGPLAWYW